MNNSETDFSTPEKPFQQRLENLPDEILKQRRFFEAGADKVPRLKGWSNPNKQKLYSEIDGYVGFDTTGHDRAVDYLFLDFDHIFNDKGEFVNAKAEKCFNYVVNALKTYCELSVSLRGAHVIAVPTAGIFKTIASGKNGKIDLGDGACLEIFYKTGGRYCLFTGNVYRCEPKAPVAHGQAVDDVFKVLLDKITKQNQKPARNKEQSTELIYSSADARKENSSKLGIEYDLFRAQIMLDAINPTALDDSDWLAVISSCKNIGVPYPVVDAFNRSDPDRYNSRENQSRWNSVSNPSFDIETLHGIAKRFGYEEKSSMREWFKLHPELTTEIIHRPAQASDDNAPPMDDETTFTSRLDYLSSLPQSPDRDNQIIAQIRDQCDWKTNRKGERLYILPTFNNLRLIFDYDPNLQKLVGYDEFQGADVLLRKPPWKRADSTNTEWTDKDDAQLRLYLREHYGELQGKQIIEDMTTKISQANSFNVVKNFFKKLPEWDGQHRAETLFIKFLRVDDTPYAREVTWNWLLGAVARIFHPGCRYQTALVLHGNQKIGKSFIIECLGGLWYIELTDNVDDSHASDAIKKGWIVEIKEMAAMRKAEINAVKAFIERSSETRRAAYDRRATTTYRHCVFAITVNGSEFPRDVTGNRRYMILHCNSKMFDYVPGLTDDFIKQVWAEVFQKYNEMFDNDKAFDEKKLALSKETEIKAEEIATHFMQDDGMTNEIKGFLDKKILPPFLWQELTREERRKFFEAGYIKLVNGKDDLIKRRQARGGKSVDDDVKKISDWLGYAGTKFVRKQDIKRGSDTIGEEFFIYGSDLRNHICAAEIFNECFGSDKRKAMYRINDILETLEGWTKGKRLQNSDTVYPDQKKPYYRNTAKHPVANSDTPAQADDDFNGEPIDPSDLPF